MQSKCHMISVYIHLFCNTPYQGAPPSKQHYEDQGALQTAKRQSCGEVQIMVGLKKYPELSTSHGAPLNPFFLNGKNMAPKPTCQERAAHQNSQTRQGGQ